MTNGYALFDTVLGRCGIGWTDRGIAALGLPEPSEERVRARLVARIPDAIEAEPPGWAADIAGVIALVAGQPVDLAGVRVDMNGVAPFAQRVYRATRNVAASIEAAGPLAPVLKPTHDVFSGLVAEAMEDAFAHGIDDEAGARYGAAQFLEGDEAPCRGKAASP